MTSEPISDDLIIGASKIAACLGPHWSARQVYYAAAQRHLPIFRIGSRLAARKSQFNAKLKAVEPKAECLLESRED